MIRVRGFNLLELMATILVAAILAAIALPSFRTGLLKHRITAGTDDLQAAVRYARTEAVMRATYVSLCASADGATCAGTDTYDTGWLVYAHPVGTTSATDMYAAGSSAGMQVLRVGAALQDVSVRAVDSNAITFGQQGQLVAVASRTDATRPVRFALCALPSSKSALGVNTTRTPGTRVAVSPYGGVAVEKLLTTDACTP